MRSRKRQTSSKENRSILIIGGGNMGASLARGLMRSVASRDDSTAVRVRIFDTAADKLDRLTDSMPIETLTQLTNIKIDDAAVILCVKPQDLPRVAQDLRKRLSPETLVISILAGTTIDDISAALDFKGAVVRAMPNIPAMVGEAATAMCANDECSEAQLKLAELVFSSVGEAHWTKEALMDAVTGLSGSGPAYIYMIIEALTDGGVKMGMPRPLASALATQTVLGSAALVKSTGMHPAVLRDQVTTPGGTTISAIHELEAHGLRSMLISAVATATERSAHLRLKATAAPAASNRTKSRTRSS